MSRLVGFSIWIVVVGLIGWFFYQMNDRSAEERRLREAITRLLSDKRVARLYVTRVDRDAVSGEARVTLKWQETGADEQTLPIREFTLNGERVYVDTLQILFDKEKAKDGDPLRGHALNLFHRIYTDQIAPKDGQRLDIPASENNAVNSADPPPVPRFYQQGPEASELQKALWSDFFRLATDSKYAEQKGVRTAQGKAVWKPVEAGKEYRITLSPTGQLDFEGPFTPDPLLISK